MIKIFYGAMREYHALKALGPKCLFIPNLSGTPRAIEESFRRFRDKNVVITTQDPYVLDLATPDELFWCRAVNVPDGTLFQSTPIPLTSIPLFMEAYRIKIEHVSEIIRTRQLWD